jgi:hypothetical protein
VVPILECYEDLGGGLYSAHFGYENKGILDAHIDISPMNSFTPEPQDRGQVKQFSPGRSRKLITILHIFQLLLTLK